MNRVLTMLAVAAIGAATAGCAAKPSHAGAPYASVTPAVVTSPGSQSTRAAGSEVVTDATLNVDVGPLALSGSMLAFPYGGGENWNRVGVVAQADGDVSQIAASHWAEGLINYVALDGAWLAYVDQSARQSDDAPNVLWSVHAINLRTGRTVVLASNGTTPDPYVPVIRAGGGYFAWTSANPDKSAKESLWHPGWANPQVLLARAEMTPGSETLTSDRLVYLGPNGRGLSGHTTGGDCWSVPLTGGTPVALTHTALVLGCAASDDGLIWTEHIIPKTRPLPADGILENPYTIWYRGYTDTKATRLHNGYSGSLPPLATAGAVAWQQDAGFDVWVAADRHTLHLVARRAALSGQYVATTQSTGTRTRIEVKRIRG